MKPDTSGKKRLIIVGGITAMAAVVYLFWYLAGTPTAPPAPATKDTAAKTDKPRSTATSPAPTASAPAAVKPGERLYTVEEGDIEIDKILRDDTKEIPQMARDLHDLVIKLNGEAQVNASRHLVNLTSDEDYGLIAGFLVDAKMNPEVIEVLFADLMNRKRELQLPLFMTILKDPKHPQNEEVKNILSILAPEDFGNDLAAWDRWAAQELEKIRKGEE